MRIREGDPLEIYTTRDGEVIFKKYSLIGGLEDFAAQFCAHPGPQHGFHRRCHRPGRHRGRSRGREAGLPGKNLSPQLEQIMEQRSIYQYRSGQERLPVSEGTGQYAAAAAAPILCGGDVLGLVLFVSAEDRLPGAGETSWPEPWRAFWASTWRPDCKGSRESDALPTPFARLSQQPEGSMDQHTDRHPHRRRQHHGQQRPPAAAGLPADGEAGGAAGEVQQAQGHHSTGPSAVVQPLCSKMARSASSPPHSVSVPV